MNVPYDAMAVSDRGSVSRSLLRGSTVGLTFTVDVNFTEMAIVFFRNDGSSSQRKISVPPLGQTHEVVAAIEAGGCLRAVCIVGWLDGVPYRLKPGAEAHLERIFNPDLKSINRNIRWDGRIDDFETRYFACLNSISANQGNFALVHYCVVSAGYTAIELGDLDKVGALASAAAPTFAQVASAQGIEMLMSYAMYNIHVALATDNLKLFEDMGRLALSYVERLQDDPPATYNAIRVVVLMAIYYFEKQDLAHASRFSRESERIMRVAGMGFPLFLNNIPEMGTIFQVGFHGVAINVRLRGLQPPDYLTEGPHETSPSNVWRMVTRLRDGGAIAKLGERFCKMCTAPAENQRPVSGRKWAVDRWAPDALSRVLHMRAQRCERRGALEDAERASRAAIAKRPRMPGIGWLLCRILTRKGRLVEGEAVVREEIKLYPKLTHVKLYLAENLEAQKRFDEAMVVLREIMSDRPDLPGLKAVWNRVSRRLNETPATAVRD